MEPVVLHELIKAIARMASPGFIAFNIFFSPFFIFTPA